MPLARLKSQIFTGEIWGWMPQDHVQYRSDLLKISSLQFVSSIRSCTLFLVSLFALLWHWCDYPFHSWEWSMPNFSCSLTRNITSHSKENLAFHSLLRWKMIIIQILATPLMHFLFKRLGECTFWAQEWKGYYGVMKTAELGLNTSQTTHKANDHRRHTSIVRMKAYIICKHFVLLNC